jgi:hypothetical protein
MTDLGPRGRYAGRIVVLRWVRHNATVSGDVERELLHEAGRVSLGWDLLGAESGSNDPGDSEGQSSPLLAGLLWRASVSLVDQLLDDVMVLRAEPDAVRWSTLVAQSQVLRGLPSDPPRIFRTVPNRPFTLLGCCLGTRRGLLVGSDTRVPSGDV